MAAHPFDRQRLASFQAGGIAAILCVLGHALGGMLPRGMGWDGDPVVWGGLLFSGFLFGATYRYIVREDQNPHLQRGAVGAFALVRTLAIAHQGEDGLHLAAIGLENFLIFGLSQQTLQWAIGAGWLLPFPSRGE